MILTNRGCPSATEIQPLHVFPECGDEASPSFFGGRVIHILLTQRKDTCRTENSDSA